MHVVKYSIVLLSCRSLSMISWNSFAVFFYLLQCTVVEGTLRTVSSIKFELDFKR